MSKHLHFIIMFLIPASVWCQTQKAINTTGNSIKGSEATFVYSVGEATGFSLTQNCLYTQGVIQPSKYPYRPGNSFIFDNMHQILLYPNPATNFLLVETDYPGLRTYQITAFDGSMVETATFMYRPINMSRLPSGIYFLTLFTSDYNKRQTFKIFKL